MNSVDRERLLDELGCVFARAAVDEFMRTAAKSQPETGGAIDDSSVSPRRRINERSPTVPV